MIKLKRAVGFWKLLIYAIGVIFGAGIYALIGKAAGVSGNSVWLSFLLGAVIASFTGLSYAELSSRMETTASEYFYVKSGFKSKRFAFLTSWLITAVDITSIATVALGFAGYFISLFFPQSLNTILFSFSLIIINPIVLVAMFLIAVLAIINYIGIKESTSLNVIFTIVESLGLLLIIGIGAFYLSQGGAIPNLLEMPNGISGIFTAVALIFFAYLGFEDLANLGEEVVDSKKTIPKAIIWALIISTIIYILVSISAVIVVPWQTLGAAAGPLALVANSVFGTSGGWMLSFIALFATLNTVLIMITATSRVVYGMAKDKSLPQFLNHINKNRQTPHNAIIIVALIAMIAVLLKDISLVAELTTLGVFFVFGMINLSLIMLRYREKSTGKHFKIPLNIGRFPVLSFLGFAFCAFMVLTYIMKFTANGIVFEFTNPVLIFFLIEILTGIVAFELLKTK